MSTTLGTIAILGSGETSPNLVSVHRELLEDCNEKNSSYILDSPFGFQENADLLVHKLVEFYKTSLNTDIKLATFRKLSDLNTPQFFKSIALLEKAEFIFAGPGSPSYASKLWAEGEIENLFKNHINKGGKALFASAAASTLGEFTLPVYEIYKVGIDPYWEKGLNILKLFDLNCTVVPHFNNKEGGNHDTSYSYVGAKRVNSLLNIAYTNLLGIDEHTALIITGRDNKYKVKGLGNVTLVTKDNNVVFESGSEGKLSDLQSYLSESNFIESQPTKKEKTNIKDELSKKIANLEIQVENNIKNTHALEMVVNEINQLRNDLRNEKKYDVSDSLRNILENANIQVEDN
jgi:hypothetical protein